MINLEKNLKKADFKEIAKSVALDLWVCREFKVLPTDERFKNLHEEQKHLLLTGFLEQPLPEEIHLAYTLKKAKTIQFTEKDQKNLQKWGYTKEAIAQAKEQFEKAGLL